MRNITEIFKKRILVLDGAMGTMIQAAGLGIAHRGKPVTREPADARIDHTDLTAALFMQGYRRDEFAR